MHLRPIHSRGVVVALTTNNAKALYKYFPSFLHFLVCRSTVIIREKSILINIIEKKKKNGIAAPIRYQIEKYIY